MASIADLEFFLCSIDVCHLQNMREKIERGQIDQCRIPFIMHTLGFIRKIQPSQENLEKRKEEKVFHNAS